MNAPEPFATPETQAALAYVKNFLLRSELAPTAIDERALALVGESVEAIDEEIAALRIEMADGLAQVDPPLSSTRINGYAIAFCELVRDRVREIEKSGRGRA